MAVALLTGPSRANAQTDGKTFRFVGVGEDPEWADADSILLKAIEDQQNDFLFPPDTALRSLPYEDAIDLLVAWAGPEAHLDSLAFLARTTPYVFAAAELLGARLKIVAVARSPTDSVTYHSYFVVNAGRYFDGDGTPYSQDIEGVKAYLSGAGARSRFLYHNRYSTSSYFLPSLFFRDNEVSSGSGGMSTEDIDSDSSKELVRRVADQDQSGEHDFAAVWTGTKAHFEATADTAPASTDALAHGEVLYIQLPSALPNDLLVSRFDVTDDIVEELTEGLEASEIGLADVHHWVPIDRDDGEKAIGALADLRMSARQKLAPLTVEISQIGDASDGGEVLEAARMAVRQSGSEFTLFDEDFHEGSTYIWTIEVQHDNKAVELVSRVDLSSAEPQVFHLSYDEVDDLTRRIGGIMRSRLDRVRYLWPYSDKAIVLRDVDFGLDSADMVWLRQMTITNARTANLGGVGIDELVAIQSANLYTFLLDSTHVRAITNPASASSGLGLDPMSQTAYRVILVRPEEQPVIFKVLSVVLVLLFALALYWAVRFDLMKRE
jgi:ABC-type phosphate/phosphonate transport system substrate-binding protein